MSVELHSAFVWDCDACGAENFERCVSGNITPEIADAVAGDSEPVASLIAPECELDENGEGYAAILVSQISIAPKHVTCRKCGEIHEAAVIGMPEDEDI